MEVRSDTFGLVTVAALLCLVVSSASVQGVTELSYIQQQAGEFLVDVGADEVNVAWLSATGVEEFGVTIQKNGGVSDIRIAQMTYAYQAGWFIWSDDWGQTGGSNATDEPEIQETADYVSLKFFSKYNVHPLSMVTDITVSKTGVILISSTLTADEDALAVTQIAWGLWGFPENVFGGSKAYLSVEGIGLQEVDLPAEHAAGVDSLFDNTATTYWMDFSKPAEGITVVNLAPPLYVSYSLGDEREWGGVEFSSQFRHTGWGEGAMTEGQEQVAKVALYIHGPGGYEDNLEMINLLVDLGKAEGGASHAMESYKDTGAKDLASQALTTATSAYDKVVAGDVAGAQEDLSQALGLLSQAENAEQMALIMHDVSMLAPVAVVAVIFIILVLIRRRK